MPMSPGQPGPAAGTPGGPGPANNASAEIPANGGVMNGHPTPFSQRDVPGGGTQYFDAVGNPIDANLYDQWARASGQSQPTYATGQWNGPTNAQGVAVAGPVGAVPTPSTQVNSSLDDLQARFTRDYGKAGGFAAPVIRNPGVDQTYIQQDRANADAQLKRLTDAANGTAPSAAQSMLQGAQMDIAQNALSIGASGRGADAGGNRRMVARTLSDNARRGSFDLATLRANEIAAARGQIGQAIDASRIANQGLALGISGQDIGAQALNQSGALTANSQNNTAKFQAGGLASGAAVPNAQIAAGTAEWKAKLDFARSQLNASKSEADRAYWTGIVTSLVGAAATVGGAYIASSGQSGGPAQTGSGSSGGSSSGPPSGGTEYV